MPSEYIHGTNQKEQNRLRLLNKLTNQPFLDFVKIRPAQKVLELGSGLGIIAHGLAEQYPTAEITGIEFSSEQIDQCAPPPGNLRYLQGDIHNIPFEAETLDVVYGRYILEHVQHPLMVLREVYRILKPGGKIFLQENTISLSRLYPDCPVFDRIWGQFVTLQEKLGGDAEIGIKLFSLLHRAGFTNLTPSMAKEIHFRAKGTLEGWIDNLIGNVEGAAQKLIEFELCKEQDIQQALEELQNFKALPDASAYFYWNRMEATK